MLRWRHGLILLVAATAFALAGCGGDDGGGGGDDDTGGGQADTTGGDGGADVGGGVCGDGALDPGEDCDGAALGAETCVTQGFAGGTLACADDCTFDTSGCVQAGDCGNGAVDPGEDCDGTNLDGETCASQGFGGGTLGCTDTCTFDTSQCEAAGECGDGTLDAGEDCDGTELGGETCETQGFASGDLGCLADCTFDTTACVPADDCGNGSLDAGEDCDGAELGGETCETQGFASGDLGCLADCTFDTTACVPADDCGNGELDAGEACDGAELDDETCVTLGFAGGELTCGEDCQFDTTNCAPLDNCGNGEIDAGEDCDGAALGDETCETQGFASGDLACAQDCTFDTSACVPADGCGDGEIDAGEDCDGAALGDETCVTQGFDSGDLACAQDCTFDTSACVTAGECGDGEIDAGEDCDGAALGDETCVTQGFESGDLACADDCTFDTTACVAADLCGNGQIDDGEDCDGAELGGATCEALQYDGGTLDCNDDCTYDTSLCEGTPPCEDDEYEENDVFADAALLGPGAYELSLCAPDGTEEDWFSMELLEGDKLVLTVGFVHADLDIDIAVYDATEAVIAVSDGVDDVEYIYGDIPADGTYYLRVYAGAGEGEVPYTLSIDTDAECVAQDDCDPGTFCDEGQTFTCLAGCLDDTNCGEGTICEEAACVPGCRADSDCAEGEVCFETQCITPGCVENMDCALGEACVDYACVTTDCSVTDTCADFDMVCDAGNGYCVECLTADDCPNATDFLCEANYCALQCAEDVYEPNGTLETAASIDLSMSDFAELGLTLCGANDSDWFTFTVEPDMRYVIDATFFDDDGDIDLFLYDGSFLEIDSSESGSDDEQIVLDTGDTGGVVYLEVFLYSSDVYSQTYDLAVTALSVECTADAECALGQVCDLESFSCVDTTCAADTECEQYGLVCDETAGYCAECGEDADCGAFETCVDNVCVAAACTDDEYEENDDQANATLLTPGDFPGLAICESEGVFDEEDWYAFDVTTGQTLAVAIYFSDDIADLELKLYDVDGNELDSSTSSSDDELVSYTADADGALYARVYSFGFEVARSNNYDMTAVIDPACAADEDCPLGEICEGFACIAGCRFDSDCEPGNICVDNACTPGCNDDGDCADGDLCGADGQCFTPACVANADCQLGEACVDNACVVTSCAIDDDCTQYDLLCDELAEWCVQCTADEDCGANETCVDNVCVFGCTDDDFEENDDQASAAMVEAMLYEGLALCEPPDATEEDWYYIDLLTGDLLTVDIFFSDATADLELQLVDQDGVTLDSSASSSDDEQVEYYADADMRVFVRVYSAGNGTAPYDMQLAVSTLECTEDVYEPNSATDGSDAAEITLPFSEAGLTLCGDKDEDWFQFDLAPETTYVFTAEFLDADGDVDIYLYAAGDLETDVDYSTSPSDDEQMEFTTDATGGRYYLRVLLFSELAQTYDLTIVVPECTVDADCGALQACQAGVCTDVECVVDADCADGDACRDYVCVPPAQGDTCGTAVVVDALPFAVTGVDITGFENDVEFSSSGASCTGYSNAGRDAVYAVALTAGQTLDVTLSPSFDGAVYVLSSCESPADAVCVAGADDAVFGDEVISWAVDADGTYYVIVDYYSSSGGPSSGTFDLTIAVQ